MVKWKYTHCNAIWFIKAIKDTLKDLNFKWAFKKKMWYYGEMKGKNLKPHDKVLIYKINGWD
jgi:hypothetical protein